MNTEQALTLALLVIEFEIESPQIDPPPDGWQRELTEARAALAELKERLHPACQAALVTRPICNFSQPRHRNNGMKVIDTL